MSAGTNTEVQVRPLRDDDVAAADEVAWAALNAVGEEFGFEMGVRDDARIAWARARIRHIASTDPGGSVVAEQDGRIVGIGLAIVRGPLWFLSLLAVERGLQAAGVGRRMLDTTLAYGAGCPSAMICASPDPKALRVYGRAGFALHAAFEATGVPDRTEVPAGLGVRDGDWDRDRDLLQDLIKARRGSPYSEADVDWCRDQGLSLVVRDGPTAADRGVAMVRKGGVRLVAAASDDAASRVLWGTLADLTESATVGYLTGDQQWAIDVALSARLSLRLVDTLCVRGPLEPPAPYLPSGIFG